jgi:acyl carrier protein
VTAGATGASPPQPPPGPPPGAVPADLAARVIAVVGVALDRDPEQIHLHSSLIDDLGAESIDFMDIVFRLEDELAVQIPDDDLWRGVFGPGELTPAVLDAGVTALRQDLPEFRWDRFPDGVKPQDLPRLATVSTIVTYLERHLPELRQHPRPPEPGHDRSASE